MKNSKIDLTEVRWDQLMNTLSQLVKIDRLLYLNEKRLNCIKLGEKHM